MKTYLPNILLAVFVIFLLGAVSRLREEVADLRVKAVRVTEADARVEAARLRCFIKWHAMSLGRPYSE